jgi:hypothetical protein
MAIEAESERYEFRPPTLFAEDAEGPLPTPVFHYNPLHDLESMWRVALWMLFNHRDNRDEVVQLSVDRQTKYARMFFPGILNQSGRMNVLKDDQVLPEAILSLPVSFKAAAIRLEMVRQGLVKCYRRVEAAAEINPVPFPDINTLFLDELKKARDRSGEVQLCPLNDPPPPKRSRRNSTASEVGSDRVTSPTLKPKAKRAKVTGM